MENIETMGQLQKRCKELEDEVQVYRDAARLYGIDAKTMLELAKSQIKTCADNIRLVEKMQEVFGIFQGVHDDITDRDVERAICHYDGDNTKPYCDLVFEGLWVIRKYLKVRESLNEWRKNHL